MKLVERDAARRAEGASGWWERRPRAEAFLMAFLDIALLVGDLGALNAAFFAAYFVRYSLQLGGVIPDEFDVSYPDYIPVQEGMTAILFVTFLLRGMYRLPRMVSWLGEVSAGLGTISIGVMVLFAAVSLARYPASSRLLFVYFWLLAVAMFGVWRLLHRLLTATFRRKGVGIRRVVVVGGNNPLGRRIMHSIATERSLDARVLGFVDLEAGEDFGRFRFLGTVDGIGAIVRNLQVDEVIVALPAASNEERLRIINLCRRRGVSFRVAPDLLQIELDQVDVDSINGIPLMAVRQSQIRGWNLLVKRLMDVTVAVMVLTFLWPIMALAALAIKLESPGPVLFRQRRVGKDGIPFEVYKFRSMVKDAEKLLEELLPLDEADNGEGRLFKLADDPRLTMVGRFLRRTSIDEVPQLINVLRNEMSLVGPRPPLPREVDKYDDWHRRRLEVSPGLTGLWQVSGRSEIGFDEMVMFDIYYIDNWSLGLDLNILLRTVPAVISGGGAF